MDDGVLALGASGGGDKVAVKVGGRVGSGVGVGNNGARVGVGGERVVWLTAVGAEVGTAVSQATRNKPNKMNQNNQCLNLSIS